MNALEWDTQHCIIRKIKKWLAANIIIKEHYLLIKSLIDPLHAPV